MASKQQCLQALAALALAILSMPSFALGCADGLQGLALHNTLRALHGAAPLTWDSDLVLEALSSSEAYIENGCATTRDVLPGETVQVISMPVDDPDNPPPFQPGSCAAATQQWYDTRSEYDFSDKPSNAVLDAVAPFTQLVWAGSSRLGCASSSGMVEDGTYACTVVVCRYKAPGNPQPVDDDVYAANVKRRIDFPPPSPPSPPSPPPSPGPVCVDEPKWAKYCGAFADRGDCTSSVRVEGRPTRDVCCKACRAHAQRWGWRKATEDQEVAAVVAPAGAEGRKSSSRRMLKADVA